MTHSWARWVWPLDQVFQGGPCPGYTLREGRTADVDRITEVVLESFRSDPAWTPFMSTVADRMGPRIAESVGHSGCRYLVVQAASRIVGVSGVARAHPTNQNLLTGPCVLPAHQGAGLGSWLLRASLLAAKDLGLAEASVFTRTNCVADRYVYPKFGSRRLSLATPPPVEVDGRPSGGARESGVRSSVARYVACGRCEPEDHITRTGAPR